MKVIGKSRLHEFCARHPELELWVSIWMFEMEAMILRSPAQLLTHYPSVTVQGNTARFEGAAKRIALDIVISFALETVCVRSIQYQKENSMGLEKSDVA